MRYLYQGGRCYSATNEKAQVSYILEAADITDMLLRSPVLVVVVVVCVCVWGGALVQ